MLMKFSLVSSRLYDRRAEVMQGLDNDGIDLVPGNGLSTKNRCQPWPRVCAARKLRFHHGIVGGNDGDQSAASVAKRNPSSTTYR